MRSRSYFILITALFVTAGARGQANDVPLIERGVQLRREHRDAEALEVFRRAYEVRPTPRARAQIALAEQALGQWVEAERDLHTSLASSDDPWIVSHRDALEGALQAVGKHLATLNVTANIAQGEVWLNDVRVGELPMNGVRLAAGRVRIEVRSQGYTPASRVVELAPQAELTEELRLTEIAEATPVAEPTLAARDSTRHRSAAGVDRTISAVEPSSAVLPVDATRRALAWGTLGAAGAFLGGGIIAQIIREDKASKYNDDAQCLHGELSRDQRCGVYRGQAESAQTLANVGYIAAGALGLGSAILFLINPGKPTNTGVGASVNIGESGIRLDITGKL
jgi:hypothetical protein